MAELKSNRLAREPEQASGAVEEHSSLGSTIGARQGLEAAGVLAGLVNATGLGGSALLKALTDPAIPLGKGSFRSVSWPLREEFGEYVVARHRNAKEDPGVELVFHFDPFPIGNVGQVVASFENPNGQRVAEIMLRQNGTPLLQVQLKLRQDDPHVTPKQEWERYFGMLGDLPQGSYDNLAAKVSQISSYRGVVDHLNISNILFDRRTGDLNLVDVDFPSSGGVGTPGSASGRRAERQRDGNSVEGLVCLMFDQFNYNLPTQSMTHEAGSPLQIAESNLIRKLLIGSHGANLPIAENQPPVSFVFSRIRVDGDPVVSAYKETGATSAFAARLEKLIP